MVEAHEEAGDDNRWAVKESVCYPRPSLSAAVAPTLHLNSDDRSTSHNICFDLITIASGFRPQIWG